MIGTKNKKRLWPTIAIGLSIFIALSLFLPALYWLAIFSAASIFPTGTYLTYPGLAAKVTSGDVYVLYVKPKDSPNLYLKVGERGKLVLNIDADDLAQMGFQLKGFQYIKEVNPIYSSASLGADGKICDLTLKHVREARVPFSSSPDGPFLTLPCTVKEFQKQFGKPTKKEYQYSRGVWR